MENSIICEFAKLTKNKKLSKKIKNTIDENPSIPWFSKNRSSRTINKRSYSSDESEDS